MRFWPDRPDLLVPVQWYFVDSDTPFVDNSGPFRSRVTQKEDDVNWADGPFMPGLMGEDYYATRTRNTGATPANIQAAIDAGDWIPRKGHYCGSARAWSGNASYADDPPLLPDVYGLSACCTELPPAVPSTCGKLGFYSTVYYLRVCPLGEPFPTYDVQVGDFVLTFDHASPSGTYLWRSKQVFMGFPDNTYLQLTVGLRLNDCHFGVAWTRVSDGADVYILELDGTGWNGVDDHGGGPSAYGATRWLYRISVEAYKTEGCPSMTGHLPVGLSVFSVITHPESLIGAGPLGIVPAAQYPPVVATRSIHALGITANARFSAHAEISGTGPLGIVPAARFPPAERMSGAGPLGIVPAATFS